MRGTKSNYLRRNNPKWKFIGTQALFAHAMEGNKRDSLWRSGLHNNFVENFAHSENAPMNQHCRRRAIVPSFSSSPSYTCDKRQRIGNDKPIMFTEIKSKCARLK